jgi:hypothetical protein
VFGVNFKDFNLKKSSSKMMLKLSVKIKKKLAAFPRLEDCNRNLQTLDSFIEDKTTLYSLLFYSRSNNVFPCPNTAYSLSKSDYFLVQKFFAFLCG